MSAGVLAPARAVVRSARTLPTSARGRVLVASPANRLRPATSELRVEKRDSSAPRDWEATSDALLPVALFPPLGLEYKSLFKI